MFTVCLKVIMMESNLKERRKRTMENFSSRSNHRQVGDIIPVDPMEETSIEENRHKVVSLLKEALEVLEKGK